MAENLNQNKNENLNLNKKSPKINLETYLKDELKLQDKIENKLQDKKLTKLAKAELKEIKDKYQQNLDNTNNKYEKNKNSIQTDTKKSLEDFKSSFVVKDLVDDFREDLSGLDKIEEDLKDYEGYEDFIGLLSGTELSEAEKEQIVDLISNSDVEDIFPSNFGEIVLPTDLESIKEIINKGEAIETKDINQKEIDEILKADIKNDNLENLNYKKTKLLDLQNSKLGETLIKEIKEKILDIDLIINTKKQEEINEQEKEINEQEKEKIDDKKEKIDDKKEINEQEKEINEQEKEKIETKKFTLKDIENSIDYFDKNNFHLEDLGTINGLNLKELFADFKSAENDDKKMEVVKKIADFFTSGGLDKFFQIAQKKGKKSYKAAYSFVERIAISSGNENLKAILQNNYPNPNFTEFTNLIAENDKKTQASIYFGNTGEVQTDGDKFFQGDTIIDLGKQPPEISVFDKNTGYNLKIKNDFASEVENISKQKQELFKEMTILKKQELKLEKNINYYENLEQNQTELQKIAEKSGKTIKEVKESIQQEKSKLQEKLEEIKENLKDKEKIYLNLGAEISKKLTEKKEKQRKNLSFLHKIGFDLIPQEMTDQIIKQVNKDKAKFGFKNDIDLANGNLGIDLDGDKNNMSFSEQKLFVKFTNKMISGSEDIPNYLTNSGNIIFVKTKKEFENTKQKENKYILNKTFSSEELTKIQRIIKNLDLKVEGELDMEKLRKIKNELKGEKILTNKLYQRNQFGAEIETKINNFFEQQKNPKNNNKEKKQQMITQDNSKKEIFIRSKIKGVSVGKISANLGLNN